MSDEDSDFLDGLFDFDHDGSTSFEEELFGYRLFEKTAEDDNSGGSEWDDEFDDEDEDSCDEDHGDPDDRVKSAWELCIFREDYDSRDEYLDALNEARFGWRECCDDGSAYGIYPYDFNTEEAYDRALEKARQAWRSKCTDGLKYGVDPELYDDPDEYEAALMDAKYGWRDYYVDDEEYDISPDDYETEEEFLAALKAAGAQPQ